MLTRCFLMGGLSVVVAGGAQALEGSQGAAQPERYEAVPEVSVGETALAIAAERLGAYYGKPSRGHWGSRRGRPAGLDSS